MLAPPFLSGPWLHAHALRLGAYPEESLDGSLPPHSDLPMPPTALAMCLRREDPSRELDFTSVRKCLVGDVTALRTVYDRLVDWGLINFTAKQKGGLPALELVADGEWHSMWGWGAIS